ncbi:MAG: UDP-N-acetyl-D-mannosamine dehydrogenase [Rhodospirillaceae bacterium]|nr:UDP-N-acetyl-D-mannosamine dehydrogenase [Rhodospirillaceae bacterium]MBT5811489.1 UDP-N-acetyl-D-mannosamine dehydrogenase [Rhodospirillaceae bacterium]
MNAPIETVSVIGLGYVGLPTAAVVASRNVQVIGVEINESVVERINNGEVHIVEPDLDMLVQATVAMGRLRATTTPEKAQVYVIAVPTPFKGDHVPDLSYVQAAAEKIAPVLDAGALVILESTSPVGTTEQLVGWLSDARPDLTFPPMSQGTPDVNVAYCPERILPGHVLRELVDNDRIIGGISPQCAERAVEFYRIFMTGECLITNARTAELAKLTENSFRDVNIAFANELSLISDKLDVDVWDLIGLANRHPRVDILRPGPGVGGHCIAVDPWFIVASTPKEARLIRMARDVNDAKPTYVVEKAITAAERFKNPVIACMGLSYKPDIDDLRESPALDITETLCDSKVGEILVVEPNVDAMPPALADKKNATFCDAATAIDKADIVVLLVGHRAFKEINRNTLNQKVVIDTQGLFA